MKCNQVKKAIVTASAVLAFTVLSRVCGLVYSYIATDVLYAESAIPIVLTLLRSLLAMCAYGTAAGGAALFSACGKPNFPAVAYAGALFLDCAFSVVYDLSRGVLGGRIVLAIAYSAAKLAVPVLCVFLGGCVMRRIKGTVGARRGGVVLALVYPTINALVLLYSIVSFMLEVDFLPYASEIVSIAIDVGSAVLGAVLSAFFAALTVKLGQGAATNSEKIASADVQSDR